MLDISILITILIFGVVVLVHELGHFFAARQSGIFVEEFAIGMGPKLFSTKGGADKTRYSLRLLPIGGFCKMLGEEESRPDEPRALNNKTVLQRMWVMAAGACMNFLLAFVLFLGLIAASGYAELTVRETIDGMPAQAAGLLPGDRLTHLDGKRLLLYEDLSFQMGMSDGRPLTVRLVRDGTLHNISITPARNAAGEYRIGIYPRFRAGLFAGLFGDAGGLERVGLLGSVGTAFNRMVFVVKVTGVGLYRLVTRQSNAADMVGPIGIATMVNDTYNATAAVSIWATVVSLVQLCALISANLGIMNLLPLPALDGGKLVFLLYEAVRRKPVPPEREGAVHFVGFVLLMLLAVFIAYQDILKLL